MAFAINKDPPRRPVRTYADLPLPYAYLLSPPFPCPYLPQEGKRYPTGYRGSTAPLWGTLRAHRGQYPTGRAGQGTTGRATGVDSPYLPAEGKLLPPCGAGQGYPTGCTYLP
uniref:Uncharacterized protein n=1 Tax=Udotea flabellum TaxID=170437 RepID=A0A386B1U3_9CHLO|nr:hypothetical protein [Udotea flabellum]AYC65681.1 hypothetical protein [Udotea flabellum]